MDCTAEVQAHVTAVEVIKRTCQAVMLQVSVLSEEELKRENQEVRAAPKRQAFLFWCFVSSFSVCFCLFLFLCVLFPLLFPCSAPHPFVFFLLFLVLFRFSFCCVRSVEYCFLLGYA